MKEHIKIYTGTFILINRLAYLLSKANISSIIKNHKESARLAGFGDLGYSTELFIHGSAIRKAEHIVENFKKEISN